MPVVAVKLAAKNLQMARRLSGVFKVLQRLVSRTDVKTVVNQPSANMLEKASFGRSLVVSKIS